MRPQPEFFLFFFLFPPTPKSELTGHRWLVRFNPVLLMSRLISINPQPSDQTDCSIRMLSKREEKERGSEIPGKFYDIESLVNGLGDSSHPGWCGNNSNLVSVEEKWLLHVKSVE